MSEHYNSHYHRPECSYPYPASNSMGTAGFVCALIALIFCWVPFFGTIMWLLGLIFSCVGLARRPKGLAIAGLVISLIGLVFLIFVVSAAFAFLGGLFVTVTAL